MLRGRAAVPLVLGLALMFGTSPDAQTPPDGGARQAESVGTPGRKSQPPAPAQQSGTTPGAGRCQVTAQMKDRPPRDPDTGSFGGSIVYANKARTIWASWSGPTSRGGYKVMWLRPSGARLQITGRRLDGEAPPLTANIPAGSRLTGRRCRRLGSGSIRRCRWPRWV
jgi:hypothetical protein